MTFFDWFDPSNSEHRNAYRALQKDGCWPREFWDKAKAATEGESMALYWSRWAETKFAQAWLTTHEGEDTPKCPVCGFGRNAAIHDTLVFGSHAWPSWIAPKNSSF
jgi:hypothetical protein